MIDGAHDNRHQARAVCAFTNMPDRADESLDNPADGPGSVYIGGVVDRTLPAQPEQRPLRSSLSIDHASLLERFWDKTIPVTESGCYFWIGAVRGMRVPYGHFRVGAQMVSAHRFIWEEINGPFQDGRLVCHKCDISLCVNPTHLFLGSPRENMQDMISKGRRVFGNRKLNDAQVVGIKEMLREGFRQTDIAVKFGVSQQAVNRIAVGVAWKNFK